MSSISVSNISDGDAVTAASVNNQINTIVNDYNGSISATNLATNAVTTVKITNANVTADKLATGAQRAIVDTGETTASTSYVNLATVTDTVTATIGANGLALVIISANAANATLNAYSLVAYAVSGANTIAATDTRSWSIGNLPASAQLAGSWVDVLTGLTPGSTTFKLKYRVTAGTGTFNNRVIAVIPL